MSPRAVGSAVAGLIGYIARARAARAVGNVPRDVPAIAQQPWCSLCGAADDLTADHVVPLAVGGDPLGRLRVLCRRCNSGRGARM
jgi:5-methylcytosine-specific restriction endonuclease McrA